VGDFCVITGNDTKDNMNTNVQLLRYWFQLSVEGFAGVRPIRVQDIEVWLCSHVLWEYWLF